MSGLGNVGVGRVCEVLGGVRSGLKVVGLGGFGRVEPSVRILLVIPLWVSKLSEQGASLRSFKL